MLYIVFILKDVIQRQAGQGKLEPLLRTLLITGLFIGACIGSSLGLDRNSIPNIKHLSKKQTVVRNLLVISPNAVVGQVFVRR